MPVDRTLERVDPDWRLYVSDFPSDQWSPNGWVAARIHVQPTARPKVEQQRDARHGELVWVAFGPHLQLFVPRDVALKLAARLNVVLDERLFVDPFSAGASVDAPLLAATASGVTASAPAEPPQPTRPDPGLSEAWLTGRSDIRNPSSECER